MHVKKLFTALIVGLGLTLAVVAGLELGLAPMERAQAQGTIYYVDDDTCPVIGSGTQGDPFCRIQTAVDAAGDDDEVRVAAGTYTGTQLVLDSRTGYTYTQVVFITASLALRGGYDAGDWNAAPDPVANPTVIDAHRSGRGVSIIGTAGVTPSVTVDGFTITGGDYTGLRNISEGTTDRGGGLRAYGSGLALRNCVITNNVASRENGWGGGVYIRAVPLESTGVHIENTTIISNVAGGTSSTGGGMFISDLSRPLTITHSVIRDNRAKQGGGMQAQTLKAPVTIEGTDFLSNTAQSNTDGGANFTFSQDGVLQMDRVRFQNNQAAFDAAAIRLYAFHCTVHARLTNVLFTGNRTLSANDDDAVIHVLRGTAAGNLELTLAHVTASDNQAPTFLYAPQVATDRWLSVTLTNTLVTSFTNGFVAEEGASSSVLVRHTNTLTDDVATLHRVVAGSPTFEAINGLTGDPKLDATYHLLLGSDAVDAGIEAGVDHDLDGDFRPQGAAPDVGADEYIVGVPPSAVHIAGPSAVAAQVSAEFVAAISPVTATQPFTYVWQATDKPPVTHTDRGVDDTISFAWDTPGAKVISVTAANVLDTVFATHTINVLGVPFLVIGKGGPEGVLAGDLITYTLTVTNEGIAAASDLVITDALPSGATYVSGGTRVGDVVSWTVPGLAADGGMAQVSFVVTATQTITNSAYGVSASGGYSATGDVPVVTVVGAPELSIHKSGPHAVGEGDPVTYTLTVVNDGTIAAQDLVITDAVPAGAYYVGGGTHDAVAGVVSWVIPSLAPGGGLIKVSFVVTATQTITNADYRVNAGQALSATGEVLVVTIVGSGTRYVASGGTDSANPCTDSGAPCATLQHAVDVAGAGDEIRVAAGTYTGTQLVLDSRTGYTYTQVVFIDKDLTLRGGYTTGNWVAPDPVTNPAVIDAEQSGRSVSIIGVNGDEPVVTVDGLTITGGDYTGLRNVSESEDRGGGLYASYTVLTLRNSIITGNVAGREGQRSCGGGVYLTRAYVGPGTWIENTAIISNSAPGINGQGGGLYVLGVSNPMTITRSTFRGNMAGQSGGGLRLQNVNTSLTIGETDFLSNTAQAGDSGGAYIAVYSADADLLMDRVRFQNNRSNSDAAALYLDGTTTTPQARLTNVIFAGNRLASTKADDAVVYIHSYADSMNVSLAHVTAADNQAPTFLSGYAWDADHGLAATLTNTLLVSFTNAFAVYEGNGGEALIRHTHTLTDDVTTLHHTVEGTPTFQAINPLSGDPKLDADYHLQFGSDAIDAGVEVAGLTSVGHDLDGQSRPSGLAPDIGADEFVPVKPLGVSVSGPVEGIVGPSYTFTATPIPPTATQPITYTWSPTPTSGQGTDTAVYSWTTPGAKTLTVLLENPVGTALVPGAHTITIRDYRIYLPLVIRDS